MTNIHCFCILSWLVLATGSADEAKLDDKLAELVSKGLITKERLAQLKQDLLDESADDREEKPREKQHASTSKTASKAEEDISLRSSSSPETQESGKQSDASAEIPPKKRPRPQSMEESMRAYGIDPDAIAKIGQRRQPTDINSYVSAALQAAQAQETARARKDEELEDQEEALKELLQDDSEESLEVDASTPDLGSILPEDLQDKLAGIMGRLGKSVDPEAGSILSALMPNAGFEADDVKDEEDDGTTEDLAELMNSVRAKRASSLSNVDRELEELRKQRQESDERMQKAAEERRAEMAKRQAQRDKEHEKFEAEMREREEQRQKDRAEFEESRRKHNEYMQRIEDRKKAAEARRSELEEKRAQQQDRMQAALKMASEHINELKNKQKDDSGVDAHDDL